EQRSYRLSAVVGSDRLRANKGCVRRFAEGRRGNLPTRIAMDAGRVHEEVTRDVFSHSLFGVRHHEPPLRFLPFYGEGVNMTQSLCETCKSMREVTTPKGSRFLLCQLSLTDPDYPKYP